MILTRGLEADGGGEPEWERSTPHRAIGAPAGATEGKRKFGSGRSLFGPWFGLWSVKAGAVSEAGDRGESEWKASWDCAEACNREDVA